MSEFGKREQAEMDKWLADVARNADNIVLLQNKLCGSPEFVALMTAYRFAPREKANEYMQTVADFVTMYLHKVQNSK